MSTARRFLRNLTAFDLLTFLAEDDGTGAGGGTTTEPKPVEGDPAGGGAAADPPAGKTFTQAELDRLVGKARTEGKTSGIEEVKSYLEAEAQSAEERANATAATATKDRDAALAKALDAQVESKATVAAIAAGVPPARVDRFLRNVELDSDDLRDDGKPDVEAIKAAVEAALKDVPEFAGSAARTGQETTQTGADFTGTDNKVKQWTAEEIGKLTPAEFEKHEPEIAKQIAAGTVK